MPEKIGRNIELYMGPKEVGGPDDLLEPIVKFIDGAKKRLLIAVQELDNKHIAEAIVRARQRKVLVKLVLEADYLLAKSIRQHPFVPGGSHEINRTLHNAILRANIKVNTDFNPKIFHQKFMVRDRQSVLTGSTNFTETGTSKNLNHLIIIHNKEIAKIFETEYKEIQQGHFGKLNEGHDETPKEIQVSKVRVKTLFAPDHNPEMEIMKQVTKAKKSVDFAIFTFAQSSGIDDTLLMAKRANVQVRGALFKDQANQKWSAKEILHNAGIDLYLVPKKQLSEGVPKIGKLHHKLMVIDKQLVIGGSFNYTGPANYINDENILIIGDLDTVDKESIKLQKKMAKYALNEIDRIINDYGDKITRSEAKEILSS